MKILYVIERYGMFGVPNNGASQRNTLFAKALAQFGHVDVCSFSEDEIVSDIEDCDVVYSNPIQDESNRFARYVRPFIRLFFSPATPPSYFKIIKKRKKVIDELVERNGYDLIACRYLQAAIRSGLLKYKDKLVVENDDNLSNSLKIVANNIESSLIKAKYLYMSKKAPIMLKKTLEEVFCSFYSSIIEPPSPNSVYLHNTVVSAARIPDIRPTTSNRILIVGWLEYPPNKNGAYHFVRNVFPMIKQRVPDAKLHIAGKGSKSMLDELNSMGEGIQALGFVEDLAAEYEGAKVVVIPIYQGSGTCVKFVEGMLMNRPIISTPVGARGLDRIAKDGEHFLLAKNDEDFVDKTVELLLNTEKSIDMANKAQELAKSSFSQERFMEIVKETIEGKLRQHNSRI